MKNRADIRRERYEQYRYNRSRYEFEGSITLIILFIIGIVIIINILKAILVALAVCLAWALVVFAFVFLYLKKQINANQAVILSKEEISEGVTATINVSFKSKTATFEFYIPSNVKNGQKFVAKNIFFEGKNGKKIKKNVHFEVQILDK